MLTGPQDMLTGLQFMLFFVLFFVFFQVFYIENIQNMTERKRTCVHVDKLQLYTFYMTFRILYFCNRNTIHQKTNIYKYKYKKQNKKTHQKDTHKKHTHTVGHHKYILIQTLTHTSTNSIILFDSSE
jgi:hypothetical protein